MAEASNETNINQEIISKEEILRQIFGEIGDLIDDFSCAVESTVLIHGRMYITNRFICFYSNLFGLEKKIRIPYSHIKSISKENTALVIPNAIAISTGVAIKDDEIKLKSVDGEAPSRKLSTTTVIAADQILSGETSSNQTQDKNGPSPTSSQKSTTESRRYSGLPLSPNNDDVVDTESDKTDRPLSVITDLNALFQQEVAKSRYKIVVISENLNISLNEFANLFIIEGAPYNFKKYHEKVKDTNVDMSQWAEISQALGSGREIKFFKPVNLPGLASTRGVKVQRYRSYENIGLILCSSTRLEDVPAADTFSVDDMIAVKSIDESNIHVEISFQVSFIKSTYMKFIIERSTNAEMTKWLETFFAYIKKISQLFKEGKLDSADQGVETETTGGEDKSSAVSLEPKIEKPEGFLSFLFSEKNGPLSIFIFNNESLGDMIKMIMTLIVILFLFLNYLLWMSVNKKMNQLEEKLSHLEKLSAQFLK